MGYEKPRLLVSSSSNLIITSGPRTGTLLLTTVVLLGLFAGGGIASSSMIRIPSTDEFVTSKAARVEALSFSDHVYIEI